MRNFIFYVFIATFTLSLSSCEDSTAKQQKIREKAIRDSIQRREVFVRDSIAKVEAAEKEKKNADTIKKYKNLFTEKFDEYRDVTWVQPKNMPKYLNRNGVYAYFALQDNKPTNFRFVFQYFDDDWLFIESMIFNIDGENITISPKMERDHGSGDIWEWCDAQVLSSGYSDDILESFIKKIAYAKTVKIRLNGSQYYDTRTMTAKQIETIKAAYEYYLALGGTF